MKTALCKNSETDLCARIKDSTFCYSMQFPLFVNVLRVEEYENGEICIYQSHRGSGSSDFLRISRAMRFPGPVSSGPDLYRTHAFRKPDRHLACPPVTPGIIGDGFER